MVCVVAEMAFFISSIPTFLIFFERKPFRRKGQTIIIWLKDSFKSLLNFKFLQFISLYYFSHTGRMPNPHDTKLFM